MENHRRQSPGSGGFRLETVWQDLRYAARQLRRNPGFALTAILTLSLGIGASTAVFSVAYGVLIDPFPYKDVHTLATPKLCWPETGQCGWRAYTPAQFNEIAEHTDIFSVVTASTISEWYLPESRNPNACAATTSRPIRSMCWECGRVGPRHRRGRRY